MLFHLQCPDSQVRQFFPTIFVVYGIQYTGNLLNRHLIKAMELQPIQLLLLKSLESGKSSSLFSWKSTEQ